MRNPLCKSSHRCYHKLTIFFISWNQSHTFVPDMYIIMFDKIFLWYIRYSFISFHSIKITIMLLTLKFVHSLTWSILALLIVSGVLATIKKFQSKEVSFQYYFILISHLYTCPSFKRPKTWIIWFCWWYFIFTSLDSGMGIIFGTWLSHYISHSTVNVSYKDPLFIFTVRSYDKVFITFFNYLNCSFPYIYTFLKG